MQGCPDSGPAFPTGPGALQQPGDVLRFRIVEDSAVFLGMIEDFAGRRHGSFYEEYSAVCLQTSAPEGAEVFCIAEVHHQSAVHGAVAGEEDVHFR